MEGLCRSDLACVGPVSSKNTLKVLPFGKSRRQKIVVGDSSGYVTCLQSKRGDTSVVFKTRTNLDNNPVTCLTLNNGDSGDKIYVAEGRSVRGINKKGKEFCEIKTNLSETLRNVVVRDKKVWVSGELTYASYEDGKEIEYVNCEDVITSMVVDTENKITLLGARDNQIRVIVGGKVVSRHLTSGGVTALELYESSSPSDCRVVYGTETGIVGLLELCRASNTLKPMWSTHSSSAAVNCISTFDLTKDDKREIILGRDDGSLQIMKIKDDRNGVLHFERFVEESIRSVQVGVVNSPGYDEIVVCTYSGNLISFTTEALDQEEEGDAKGRTKAAFDVDGKVKTMKDEIAKLQKKIDSTRNKLSKSTKSKEALDGIGFQQLQVNETFSMKPDDGSYLLSFELPVPIDSVLLQSSIPLRLLDLEASSSQQQNVVISTAGTEGLQAVYRCTESCKRMEIRLRTIEGQYGTLKATVMAKIQPKLAKQLLLDIKPLSLHYRIASPPKGFNKIPLSSVKFTGNFSLNQVHDWLRACLPGIPHNVPNVDAQAVNNMYFENTLVKSVLRIQYKEGLTIVESDSISAISIMREVVTGEANKRSVGLKIGFTINPETVPCFLKKMDKQLRELAQLSQKVQVLDALKEIASDSGGDTSFLPKEFQSVLKNARTYVDRHESRPKALETMFGIIFDLYVDEKKFARKDVKNATTHRQLVGLLENYDYNTLLEFFQS